MSSNDESKLDLDRERIFLNLLTNIVLLLSRITNYLTVKMFSKSIFICSTPNRVNAQFVNCDIALKVAFLKNSSKALQMLIVIESAIEYCGTNVKLSSYISLSPLQLYIHNTILSSNLVF